LADALPAIIVDLADLGVRAADFARAARSPSTLRSYRTSWADFIAWCDDAGLPAMPSSPETIGLYFAARASELSVATLRHRLAAISVANNLAGHRVDTRHPAIADVLSGIRRELGRRAHSKSAVSVDELRRILRKLPDNVAGTRDRAILLIGFAGAFRRSELTALNIGDLTINSRGVAIMVRHRKTDQQGLGATIGIPRSRKATCPVAALETWLNLREVDGIKLLVNAEVGLGQPRLEVPVFRPVSRDGHVSLRRLSDGAVARVVKVAAERIGLDPRKYAGHSLRRGFMTAASAAGADLAQIMKQSRHRSTAVAMGYVDEGRIFSNPASRAIGL
jgi:integrase